MPRCSVCNRTVAAGDPFHASPTFNACETCYVELSLGTCTHCGSIGYPENLVHTAGDVLCRDCSREAGAYCVVCDYFWPHEMLFDGKCPECKDKLVVYPFDYKPKFQFLAEPRESAKLYYGVELEIELPNPFDICTAQPYLPDTFYLKKDGSLHYGVEIVCHPMTMRYLKTHAQEWEKVMAWWTKNGAQSDRTNTCGMHVHMSLDAFSQGQIYKMCEFVRKNEAFILSFTSREKHQLDRWAYVDVQRDALRKARNKEQCGMDRHSAINLATGTTLELRIFKGTLQPFTFWRNIEFCECLYGFTLNHSFGQMEAPRFLAYATKHFHQWPRLVANLTNRPYKEKHSCALSA